MPMAQVAISLVFIFIIGVVSLVTQALFLFVFQLVQPKSVVAVVIAYLFNLGTFI